MKKKIAIYFLLWLAFASCVPQQEVAQRVMQTLTALHTLTRMPTYTDNPTYTPFPTNTRLRSTTAAPRPSKTPDYTESAKPTSTKRPTQSMDGTGAVTATQISTHFPGQAFDDGNCGISFEYPLEWTIEYAAGFDPERYICLYGLKPDNYLQIKENADYCMGDYAIIIGVRNMNFSDAAKAAGFFYENGQWYSSAGLAPYMDAIILTTRGLTILRAGNPREVWDNKCLGRLGIWEYDIAMINSGGNKSAIMTDDTTVFNLHFEYILQTIKIY